MKMKIFLVEKVLQGDKLGALGAFCIFLLIISFFKKTFSKFKILI
jgi:hypothetical protein